MFNFSSLCVRIFSCRTNANWRLLFEFILSKELDLCRRGWFCFITHVSCSFHLFLTRFVSLIHLWTFKCLMRASICIILATITITFDGPTRCLLFLLFHWVFLSFSCWFLQHFTSICWYNMILIKTLKCI
jgi:hypothetical protein